MKKRTRTLRGVTLTEALLFLGLAAIAIVGAFALYNNATGSSKTNDARVQLQAMIGQIQALYSTQNDFSSLDTELVIAAGLAPKAAIDGDELINPWGGLTVVEGDTRTYSITFEEVPNESCISLLSSGLLDNGAIYQMGANGDMYGDEIQPDDAVDSCDNDDDNDVEFVAR